MSTIQVGLITKSTILQYMFHGEDLYKDKLHYEMNNLDGINIASTLK